MKKSTLFEGPGLDAVSMGIDVINWMTETFIYIYVRFFIYEKLPNKTGKQGCLSDLCSLLGIVVLLIYPVFFVHRNK